MESVQESLAQLTKFYDTPMGAVIYGAEKSVLRHYLSHFFGYFLVQVGGPGDLSWLSSSPIRNHYRYADVLSSDNVAANCYGDLQLMPFDTESIDVLFLPHTLEIATEAEAVLDEAVRCLIPEGVVILFNFVPHRLLYFQKGFNQLLPDLKWHNYTQLRSAMNKYNLTIEVSKSFFHRPYRESAKSLQRLRSLETLGQALWPWMGNIQVIIARKKRFTMTPLVKPVKKQRTLILGKEVAPTTRNQT